MEPKTIQVDSTDYTLLEDTTKFYYAKLFETNQIIILASSNVQAVVEYAKLTNIDLNTCVDVSRKKNDYLIRWIRDIYTSSQNHKVYNFSSDLTMRIRKQNSNLSDYKN